ncbi:hypothetical protein FNV43_RR04408 [Rhamnella rubrinervis]|uniref:CHY-type domain-containing protein n=1 Tax=Rhamnella rubrinervis TaxID=2594499 RepID=A0A8K0MPJ2_9ROSA|nr:hypothetical protein FNV43_RR04408 [Rhamnella rubrinervis]
MKSEVEADFSSLSEWCPMDMVTELCLRPGLHLGILGVSYFLILLPLLCSILEVFGMCSHYRRKCKIRAPCCNEIFDCRHCHNEVKNSLETNPIDRHDVPRHEVEKVICSYVKQSKMYSNTALAVEFAWENTFAVYASSLMTIFQKISTTVTSVEYAEPAARKISSIAKHVFLFDSMKEITVLPCGHTIHFECVKEMRLHLRYSCPVCSKSMYDMSKLWKKLDEAVASTPMPEIYKNKMVWILCNDCGAKSKVNFNIVAHKCLSCVSYNTRQIQGGPDASCSPYVAETVR